MENSHLNYESHNFKGSICYGLLNERRHINPEHTPLLHFIMTHFKHLLLKTRKTVLVKSISTKRIA